jgi:hypothetical protein
MRFLESTCVTGTHEMRQAVVTAQLIKTTKTLNVKNFRVRIPYPFQWGGPTFDVGDVFGIMVAAFAALVEVSFLSLGEYWSYHGGVLEPDELTLMNKVFCFLRFPISL